MTKTPPAGTVTVGCDGNCQRRLAPGCGSNEQQVGGLVDSWAAPSAEVIQQRADTVRGSLSKLGPIKRWSGGSGSVTKASAPALRRPGGGRGRMESNGGRREGGHQSIEGARRRWPCSGARPRAAAPFSSAARSVASRGLLGRGAGCCAAIKSSQGEGGEAGRVLAVTAAGPEGRSRELPGAAPAPLQQAVLPGRVHLRCCAQLLLVPSLPEPPPAGSIVEMRPLRRSDSQYCSACSCRPAEGGGGGASTRQRALSAVQAAGMGGYGRASATPGRRIAQGQARQAGWSWRAGALRQRRRSGGRAPHLRALRHQRQPVDVRLLHDVDSVVHGCPLHHLHQHLHHVLAPVEGRGGGEGAGGRVWMGAGRGGGPGLGCGAAGGPCGSLMAPSHPASRQAKRQAGVLRPTASAARHPECSAGHQPTGCSCRCGGARGKRAAGGGGCRACGSGSGQQQQAPAVN